MNEYSRLINEYLCKDNTIYWHNKYEMSVFTSESLFSMLHNLKPFEAPDMYANLNGSTYIIEHFAFDASKETRKGMTGQCRENKVTQVINAAPIDNEWHIEPLAYNVSPIDYKDNFTRHFDSHYRKINLYKENLIKSNNATKNDKFIVGFWIECLYPPYYCQNRKFVGELLYFETKQFRDKLLNAVDLDFVLFSSYAGGQKRLFYLDKSTVNGTDCLDLERDDIVFSSINNNEIAMYGNFSEDSHV